MPLRGCFSTHNPGAVVCPSSEAFRSCQRFDLASCSLPIVLQRELVSTLELDTRPLVPLSPCASLVAGIFFIRSRRLRPLPLWTSFSEPIMTFLSKHVCELAVSFFVPAILVCEGVSLGEPRKYGTDASAVCSRIPFLPHAVSSLDALPTTDTASPTEFSVTLCFLSRYSEGTRTGV